MKKLVKKVVTGVLAVSMILSSVGVSYASEWQQDEVGWWVRSSDGSTLADTWYQDSASGLWYYMGADEYMLTSTTTPDGYTVNADGVWIQNTEAVFTWKETLFDTASERIITKPVEMYTEPRLDAEIAYLTLVEANYTFVGYVNDGDWYIIDEGENIYYVLASEFPELGIQKSDVPAEAQAEQTATPNAMEDYLASKGMTPVYGEDGKTQDDSSYGVGEYHNDNIIMY